MGETRFVRTESGAWINVAHVVRIAPGAPASKYGASRYLLYGATGGESLGVVCSGRGVDWEDVMAPVVPAAAGTVAYLVAICADNDARPTDTDVVVRSQTVAAWRLMQDCNEVQYAHPILPEAPWADMTVLLPMPDGKLLSCDFDFAIYEDLAQAKAGLLSAAQFDWDRKHQHG